MSRTSGATPHLETCELREELCAALKEDEGRKKTDAMKKRAIHTAASYDEFRHMVSCAQLTPVTRKEMEMLSDQKRGWQGRSGSLNSTTNIAGSSANNRRKPSSRRNQRPGAAKNHGNVTEGPLRSPEDHSEFQRVWRRRCRTDEERRSYLHLIGAERLSDLFRVEMEPDVLAQVLSLICVEFLFKAKEGGASVGMPSSPMLDQSGACRTLTVGDARDAPSGDASSLCAAKRCAAWLHALTKTGRFEINIQFLDKTEKAELDRALERLAEAFGKSSAGNSDTVQSLYKAYSA